ncbi:MAG: FixH family protein [Armatimonadota bacterium]|nr:FixH family protein [Armatimonadota bacterium]MDR7449981.1 FixH family protein [Armatimonadota bacterium]MDR7459322.1 FixH family protein [Armatimonadota bacterium]MDR7479482.1 FixH family protein [Armatimonadota bacterium]MDR7488188.1 FixH family protein [Armatimonadota bacterium]
MTAARRSHLPVPAAILAAATIGVLLQAIPVRAHATFVRSDPPAGVSLTDAPAHVRVWFSEPVELRFTELTVFDVQGRRVDRGGTQPVPGDRTAVAVALAPLEPSVYTVAWRALSAVDGHVTRGSFSLLVGPATVPPPPEPPQQVGPAMPLEAAVRWAGYLAGAVLLGLLLLGPLALGPALRGRRLDLGQEAAARAREHRLVWAAWTGLLLASVGALVVQGVLVGGTGTETFLATLGQLAWRTRFGQVWALRVAGVIVAALLLPRALRAGGAARVGTALLAAGVLATTALNSHSAAAGAAVAVVADWVHLLGVSVWVGGLVGLVAVLPLWLRALPRAQRQAVLAEVVPRFSRLAVAAVSALVASGLVLAWTHVGTPAAMRETLYGRTLGIKLLLVVPLVLLGGVNLTLIRPKLAAAVRGPARRADAVSGLARLFHRIVTVEVLLAVLVLGASAVLTSLAPARDTYARLAALRPFRVSATAGDLSLTVALSPGRPGLNTVTVTVRDRAGRPVTAQRVDLRFTYLDQPVGTVVERARPAGPGAYVVSTAAAAVVGRWQVELLVRRAGMEDARTAVRFRLTPTGAEADRPPEPLAGTTFWQPRTVGGVVVGLVGIAVLVVALRQRRGRRRAAAAATGAFLAAAGLFLAVQAVRGEQALLAATNPFSPTAESLRVGEVVYRARCQVCHGVEGRGDGPAAATMVPRPADFRIHMAAGHTDGQLFYWVTNGVTGTAMPAFRDVLTPEERWHVINFIRTFAPTDR